MPVIAPLVALMLRPAGRAGETLKVSGGVPPEPVTGVNDADGWFTVSIVVDTAVIATTALFTVSEKLEFAVAPLASVTVTL
jgi:hypothetical protein